MLPVHHPLWMNEYLKQNLTGQRLGHWWLSDPEGTKISAVPANLTFRYYILIFLSNTACSERVGTLQNVIKRYDDVTAWYRTIRREQRDYSELFPTGGLGDSHITLLFVYVTRSGKFSCNFALKKVSNNRKLSKTNCSELLWRGFIFLQCLEEGER